MFCKSTITIAIVMISLFCSGQNKGHWKDNVKMKNSTDKELRVKSIQLYPEGWDHSTRLHPFTFKALMLDSFKTKPSSEVTVLWEDFKENEKKTLVKIVIPPIIEKKPEILAYFVFNFDKDNCFLSYEIYTNDDPEYFSPIREILPDGSDYPLMEEDKKAWHCRKPDGSPEDAHYEFAFLVVDRDKEYWDVEFDQKCKILYARDKKAQKEIQAVIDKSQAHEIFILPATRRIPLKLTKEWKILTDLTLSKPNQ